MDTLELTTLECPVFENEPEETYIKPNKEYFAVTTDMFLVYRKSNCCWYCLITKMLIPGRISDVIDSNGNMHLFVKGKPMTHGKYGTADTLDAILGLFNSGTYLEWLRSVS